MKEREGCLEKKKKKNDRHRAKFVRWVALLTKRRVGRVSQDWWRARILNLEGLQLCAQARGGHILYGRLVRKEVAHLTDSSLLPVSQAIIIFSSEPSASPNLFSLFASKMRRCPSILGMRVITVRLTNYRYCCIDLSFFDKTMGI